MTIKIWVFGMGFFNRIRGPHSLNNKTVIQSCEPWEHMWKLASAHMYSKFEYKDCIVFAKAVKDGFLHTREYPYHIYKLSE